MPAILRILSGDHSPPTTQPSTAVNQNDLPVEVETVFLFPWAVIARELGVAGLFSILFFLIILILGLAYAWRKGALEWK